MANGQTDRVAIYQALSDAYELIEDAIVLAKNGLLENPTPEERRSLDKQILELAERSAIVEAKMLAARRGEERIAMPSKTQLDSIAVLTGEVEALRNQSVAAADAIALAGRVLEMAKGLKLGA